MILILYPNHWLLIGIGSLSSFISRTAQLKSGLSISALLLILTHGPWPDNDLCSCDKTRIQSNQYKGRGIGRYRPLNGQLIIHSSGSRKGIMRIIRNLDPETLSHSDCHKHNLKSLKMTQNLITFNVRQKNYYRVHCPTLINRRQCSGPLGWNMKPRVSVCILKLSVSGCLLSAQEMPDAHLSVYGCWPLMNSWVINAYCTNIYDLYF